MATTSPDNIRTPDPGDSYNLVADLATMANDVQDALTLRANSYIGTAAQRAASTGLPPGSEWRDTDGSRLKYVLFDGVWEPSGGVDTGWVSLAVAGGWTQQSPTLVRQIGNTVYFRGVISHPSFTGGFTTVATLPAQIDPPLLDETAYIGQNTPFITTIRVQANRNVQLYRENTSSAWANIGSLTYLTD